MPRRSLRWWKVKPTTGTYATDLVSSFVHALARGHWKLHPRGSQQRSQQPSLELLQLGLVGLGKVVQFAALSTSLLFDNPGCRNFHHWTLLFGASPIAQTLPKLWPPWTLEAALRVSGPSRRAKNEAAGRTRVWRKTKPHTAWLKSKRLPLTHRFLF